jgi:hypothetical protein
MPSRRTLRQPTFTTYFNVHLTNIWSTLYKWRFRTVHSSHVIVKLPTVSVVKQNRDSQCLLRGPTYITLHHLESAVELTATTDLYVRNSILIRQRNFILCKDRRSVFAWFQASATKQMRTALFWVITQRAVVISYRRFGTIYRSHLQGTRFWTLEERSSHSTLVILLTLHYFHSTIT